MFKQSNYTNQKFNSGEFFDFFQVNNLNFMDQLDSCGGNELLMVLDSGLSNLPATIGSFLSAGTQVGLGWEKADTALFISRDKLAYAWDRNDWNGIGEGFMLGLSQVLKYEAPPASVAVSPTSN